MPQRLLLDRSTLGRMLAAKPSWSWPRPKWIELQELPPSALNPVLVASLCPPCAPASRLSSDQAQASPTLLTLGQGNQSKGMVEAHDNSQQALHSSSQEGTKGLAADLPRDNSGPVGHHPSPQTFPLAEEVDQFSLAAASPTSKHNEVTLLTYSRRVKENMPTPLLPLSDVQRSRRKTLPAHFTPRCSAGLAASTNQCVPVEQWAQLMLARKLGLATEVDTANLASITKYKELFENQLLREHIIALADLFRMSAPRSCRRNQKSW